MLHWNNHCRSILIEKIKKELGQTIKVYTFHKLALEILKDAHIHKKIAQDDLLEYMIEEILASIPSEYFEKLFLDKKYSDQKEFLEYKKVIARFIRLFMANYYESHYFDVILKKARKKDLPLLLIIKKIYEMYVLEKESCGMIDFDDMIYFATKTVLNRGINRQYHTIIVDEYQDTSMIR